MRFIIDIFEVLTLGFFTWSLYCMLVAFFDTFNDPPGAP